MISKKSFQLLENKWKGNMVYFDERSRLKSAYYESLKNLHPNSMKTVQSWIAQSRGIKASSLSTDIVADFQEVLAQLDKLYDELPKMVLSKIIRQDKARLVSQNIPDRNLTTEPSKTVNGLGKKMVKLNLPASYLLADALEFISLMNKDLNQLEMMSMRENELFNTKDKLDMKRIDNMSKTFQEWKNESIKVLDEAIKRIERAFEIYQEVGNIEQWKKTLLRLKRLIDKYNGKWSGDGDISLQAYVDGRAEIDKIWAELLDQIPDDFELDNDIPAEIDEGLPKRIGVAPPPTPRNEDQGEKPEDRWIGPMLRQRYLDKANKLVVDIENSISSKSMKTWLLKAHVVLI